MVAPYTHVHTYICTYICVCVCLSPSAVDLVRMTVCMTRLLVKEKLKQFSDLCFRAEVCVQWGQEPLGGGGRSSTEIHQVV